MKNTKIWKNVWVISKQYELASQEEILLVLDPRTSEDKVKWLMREIYLMKFQQNEKKRWAQVYMIEKKINVYDDYKTGFGKILYVGINSKHIYKANICANIRKLNIETGEIEKTHCFERIEK